MSLKLNTGAIALFTMVTFAFTPFDSAQAIGRKKKLNGDKTSLPSEMRPRLMKGIGIKENLGATVTKTFKFKDDRGKDVDLNYYLKKDRPIILALIYFNCPMLCNLHLKGLAKAFQQMKLEAGTDYEFLAVSIDPSETPELGRKKKQNYLRQYKLTGQAKGWHFLTGDQKTVKALANEVGFHYKWDEKTKQWAHSAAAYVLSPQGRITFYHYGIVPEPKTIRLSLVEASQNKIGNIVDRVVLFCLRYDPKKGSYAFYAFNLMRIVGIVTIVVLAIFLYKFRELRK